MRIPNGDRAIVDEAKVRNYLLSPEHPVGRYKARVFAAAGYRRREWRQLLDDLRALAATAEAQPGHTDPFGQRWIVTGNLHTPTAGLLPIRTIWLIPSEGESPRFITAYPHPSP